MEKALTADLVSLGDIKKVAGILKRKHDAVRVILFGSKADGNESKDSDIDLCVLVDAPPRRMQELRRAIRRDIRSVIHAPVDVLVYEAEAFRDRSAAEVSLEAQIEERGIDL